MLLRKLPVVQDEMVHAIVAVDENPARKGSPSNSGRMDRSLELLAEHAERHEHHATARVDQLEVRLVPLPVLEPRLQVEAAGRSQRQNVPEGEEVEDHAVARDQHFFFGAGIKKNEAGGEVDCKRGRYQLNPRWAPTLDFPTKHKNDEQTQDQEMGSPTFAAAGRCHPPSGKAGTGKSTLMRDLMYHVKDKLDFGIAMSPTEESNESLGAPSFPVRGSTTISTRALWKR